MKTTKIIFVILCAILFAGCGNQQVRKTLNQAESIMDQQPDSALSLLKQIEGNRILSEKQNALYALLYSQALDKNYIDITNDSLINIAVDYYQNHGSARHRFLSLFYQGRVYYNAKNYAKSMIAYTQAEQLYDKFDDDYYKGMLQTQKGTIYDRYANYKKGLEAYQEAYRYYDKANKQQHKLYANYHIATGFGTSNKTYDLSKQKYCETIELAKQQNDTTLIKLCLTGLITLSVADDKYEDATKWFNVLKNNYGDDGLYSKLYSCIAVTLAHNGDFEESDRYIKLAGQTALDAYDSISFFMRSSETAYLKSEYKNAYNLLESGQLLEVQNTRKHLEQPILSEQIKVIEKDLEISKYKQRNNVIMFGLTMVIASMLLVYLVVYYRSTLRRKQQRIDDYSNLVMDLQHTISDKDSAASETIQTIFKGHFDMLNNLGDSITLFNDSAKNQKTAIREIKNLITQFDEDKKSLKDLENTVNRCCNNVMSIVRDEIPNLSEEDYRQLCYHFAGFSGKVISMLLDKSSASIYTRKSRLKEKIKQSDAEHKDMILGYLS